MIRRIGWDDYYLGVCKALAKRSDCTRRQVGSCVVNGHTIVGTGYNAAPAGKPSCMEGACPRGQLDNSEVVLYKGYDNCIAIHSEANSLLRAGRSNCIGATLYVTCPVCHQCKILAEAAGISKIIYSDESNETVCIEL